MRRRSGTPRTARSRRRPSRLVVPLLIALLFLQVSASSARLAVAATHRRSAAVSPAATVVARPAVVRAAAVVGRPHPARAGYPAGAPPEPPVPSSTGPAEPVVVDLTLTGSPALLAREILWDPNVALSGRDVFADIADTAAGRVGTAGVPVNPALLRLILAVSEHHTVAISSIEGGGTGHCPGPGGGYEPMSVCPNDPHYNGDAVDFSAVDGQRLSGRDPGSLVIIDTAVQVLPPGSGFGQVNCGWTPPLPAGWVLITDTCNHLHVQVPLGSR